MKNINNLLVLFLCLWLPTNLWAKESVLHKEKIDSSGLRISQTVFKEKMKHYTDLMKEEAEFTEEEYIEMVLIDNTYLLFMKNANPAYHVQAHNEYLDFLKYYMNDIIKRLEATEEGCNGGYYSLKHDLCVGGTEPNRQSVYDVFE